MNRLLKMFSIVLLLLTGKAFAQADVVWFSTDIYELTPKQEAAPKPVAHKTTKASELNIRLALTEKYIGDDFAEIKGTVYFTIDHSNYSYPVDLSLDQEDNASIGHLVYFAEFSGNTPSNLVTITILKRGIFLDDTEEQITIDLNDIKVSQ